MAKTLTILHITLPLRLFGAEYMGLALSLIGNILTMFQLNIYVIQCNIQYLN